MSQRLLTVISKKKNEKCYWENYKESQSHGLLREFPFEEISIVQSSSQKKTSVARGLTVSRIPSLTAAILRQLSTYSCK